MTILGLKVTSGLLALGFIEGMTYGILAVGLVLVYRSSRVINFAHGEIGAFGAAVGGVAVVRWHLPYWLAFLFAVATSAAVGAGAEVAVSVAAAVLCTGGGGSVCVGVLCAIIWLIWAS